MSRWRAWLFWAAVLLSLILMKNGPMGWIYPMAAVVYRWREPLRRALDRWPLWAVFIGSGVVFGLLTETFAILDNLPKPPEKRILMHPVPGFDLVFGFFYYGMFMSLWWLLRRRRAFTKTGVLVLSGLFGIATEQGGAIALGILASPFLGTVTAFLVASVYGIFPTLALLLTEHRWPPVPRPCAVDYLMAGPAFFLLWALYGLIVHRSLLALFPK